MNSSNLRFLSSPSPKSSIPRPNPNTKPKTVKIKSPSGTGSDAKIPWATHPTTPPLITYNKEEVI